MTGPLCYAFLTSRFIPVQSKLFDFTETRVSTTLISVYCLPLYQRQKFTANKFNSHSEFRVMSSWLIIFFSPKFVFRISIACVISIRSKRTANNVNFSSSRLRYSLKYIFIISKFARFH